MTDNYIREVLKEVDELLNKTMEKSIFTDAFRLVIKDFITSAIQKDRARIMKELENLKPVPHTDHNNKDEWYACLTCMQETNIEKTLDTAITVVGGNDGNV